MAAEGERVSMDSLFDYEREAERLGGEGFLSPDHIDDLNRAVDNIVALMIDYQYHSQEEIKAASGGQMNYLRRMRDARKRGHVIAWRYVKGTRITEYRFVRPDEEPGGDGAQKAGNGKRSPLTAAKCHEALREALSERDELQARLTRIERERDGLMEENARLNESLSQALAYVR